MEQTFLTSINIERVRHLANIFIPLDKEKRKHLILTGKNGSGKTSVLEAVVKYIQGFLGEKGTSLEHAKNMYERYLNEINRLNLLEVSEENRKKIYETKKNFNSWKDILKEMDSGVDLDSTSNVLLKEKYEQGNYIFAYYKAAREFQVEQYKNIEKVELKDKYNVIENPGAKLTKYLVDLKATQAFTKDGVKVEKINKWFLAFENILKTIFEDDNLKLKFNDETFQFSICESDRGSFDFNTMSSGYAAVFDIINDLIIRMEAQSGLRTEFDMEGVVLVDEIETHLHLELQKKILPVLTTLFPNIQFIITTHSPFILSSLDNAVIYDLENKTRVENGLKNLPYEGIVEGYFKADKLSKELRDKFERYKVLVSKSELLDEEYEELDRLEFYLDEIPDYLAKELTAEYSRLKLEFSNRGARAVIKIDRNPIPPPSLAIEAQKVQGVYNKPDVIQRLKEDSNDKCYICELGGLSDPEVEHLRPHYGRKIPERVFDWNNLFYACPHCNNLKKEAKYDDKIIDCCVENPEDMIEQCYEKGHVKVHNIVHDECAIMTAELIQDCFEKCNTGIREAACQHRINRLADEMNVLYKTLEKYKREPELQRYKRSLRATLSRTSIFASFKRNYVRKHIKDYPDLEEFLG